MSTSVSRLRCNPFMPGYQIINWLELAPDKNGKEAESNY